MSISNFEASIEDTRSWISEFWPSEWRSGVSEVDFQTPEEKELIATIWTLQSSKHQMLGPTDLESIEKFENLFWEKQKQATIYLDRIKDLED